MSEAVVPRSPTQSFRLPTASRIPALDCTRGLAMLFACLSHFSYVAALTVGHGQMFGRLMRLSMIASPTFVLVSGITLGYMGGFGGTKYEQFARKLRVRGVVLLTAVHVLMMPGFYFVTPGWQGALRTLPITDTIAVCVLVGPWVVSRLNGRRRLVLATALIALSWAIVSLVPDTLPVPVRLVVEAFFGSRGTSWWLYNFAVVPWFSAYLLGTAIGEDLASSAKDRRPPMSTVLLRWAAKLAGTAAAAAGALLVSSRMLTAAPQLAAVVRQMANPFGKLPPSPVYLLGQGAISLVMTATVTMALERGWLRWATSRLIDIGRSSLIVFVVQSYLYYIIELRWVHPTHLWPLMFLGSLAMVHLTARGWLAVGGNRLLTPVGLREMMAGARESATRNGWKVLRPDRARTFITTEPVLGSAGIVGPVRRAHRPLAKVEAA